ncbi:MAG: HAD-IA family hydrolase [Bacteroidales bacterium]|nr:HAD-IA family hydrolase [Bacteroidales bacterium]
MNCKLVIFDLDGTLIDTIADLGGAVNEALRVKGLPLHGPEAFRGMVGHGVRNLVKRAMPEAMQSDEQALDELLAIFLEYYLAHIDDRSRPYPGIPELLRDLNAAGISIAVASNKFQAGTEKLVRRLFPQVSFAAVCGGRPELPLKPDPAVVQGIWAQTGLGPADTVMVGDSGTDIATARAAGIPVIAVTWGFRPREALTAADRLADSTAQLRALLLGK